jgi:hypothetical protein
MSGRILDRIMTMNLFAPRYLSFDIESSKLLPAGASEILAYRPLGVSCAAASLSDSSETVTWFGRSPGGGYAPQMSPAEAASMVRDLMAYVRDGYTLVTWNGLGFDFDILAEESGLHAECAELALDHIDMLFHAVCVLGHPVSLQKATEGTGIDGKLAEMSGAEAPAAWAAGRFEEVLAYVRQDALATVELAEVCEERRELAWITRTGKKRRMPLEMGWLNVRAACQLPLPDTSWMSDPPSRERFTSWVDHVPVR